MVSAAATPTIESIGRRGYSRKDAERARRTGVPLNVFLPKRGETVISVDEIDQMTLPQVAQLANSASGSRSGSFRGWAMLAAVIADQRGRHVRRAPIAENLHHCEIQLPPSVATDRDEQKSHALELANASKWRDWP